MADTPITATNIDALSGGDTNQTPLMAQPNPAALGGANPPPPQMAPEAQPQPSVWKNVLMGALVGLAGSAGARGRQNFASGLAQGAEAELNFNQQQKQNANQQQLLKMESVRAADSHIAALDQHARAEQLSSEAKLDYKLKSAQYQQLLQDSFGIAPDLSFADDSNQATAGLQTLANSK